MAPWIRIKVSEVRLGLGVGRGGLYLKTGTPVFGLEEES